MMEDKKASYSKAGQSLDTRRKVLETRRSSSMGKFRLLGGCRSAKNEGFNRNISTVDKSNRKLDDDPFKLFEKHIDWQHKETPFFKLLGREGRLDKPLLPQRDYITRSSFFSKLKLE